MRTNTFKTCDLNSTYHLITADGKYFKCTLYNTMHLYIKIKTNNNKILCQKYLCINVNL